MPGHNMTDPSAADNSCPCGSSLSYGECCRRYHQGIPAKAPDALMRARYTAFALGKTDYLLQTWHPSTRPTELDAGTSPNWISLQVLASGQQGNRGQVHFRATYKADGNQGWGYLEEISEFVHENQQWYYVSGKTTEGVLKPGRNDRCPCGSGRKYKACCL